VKPVNIHRLARAELDKAVAWYNKKQPGIGLELLDDVLSALEKIERDPGIGANYGTSILPSQAVFLRHLLQGIAGSNLDRRNRPRAKAAGLLEAAKTGITCFGSQSSRPAGGTY
jgi:hypothetical protein